MYSRRFGPGLPVTSQDNLGWLGRLVIAGGSVDARQSVATKAIWPSSGRSGQLKAFQFDAVAVNMRQVVLRLLHKPAFGTSAKYLF